MNRHIVLFDMDGTLTEPREKFNDSLSSSLSNLSHYANIGIVTGSDLDYLKEQMNPLLNSPVRYCLRLLPCNGTKFCDAPEFPSDEYKVSQQVNMQEQIGKKRWRTLMEILIKKQMFVADFDIPLTGHFISPRGSMINFSPSGRNAGPNERRKFINYDSKYKFRKRTMHELKKEFEANGLDDITIKLGGDTSFDIYPDGWDKIYALRYFQDSTVWFVGDRARKPSGNDYEIFKACEPRSYHTTGPEETKEVIEDIIKRIKESK
jgi:phosphomannomutase